VLKEMALTGHGTVELGEGKLLIPFWHKIDKTSVNYRD
jgi:hypothetical protein